jgi:hypothetical protein
MMRSLDYNEVCYRLHLTSKLSSFGRAREQAPAGFADRVHCVADGFPRTVGLVRILVDTARMGWS